MPRRPPSRHRPYTNATARSQGHSSVTLTPQKVPPISRRNGNLRRRRRRGRNQLIRQPALRTGIFEALWHIRLGDHVQTQETQAGPIGTSSRARPYCIGPAKESFEFLETVSIEQKLGPGKDEIVATVTSKDGTLGEKEVCLSTSSAPQSSGWQPPILCLACGYRQSPVSGQYSSHRWCTTSRPWLRRCHAKLLCRSLSVRAVLLDCNVRRRVPGKESKGD